MAPVPGLANSTCLSVCPPPEVGNIHPFQSVIADKPGIRDTATDWTRVSGRFIDGVSRG